MTRILVLHPSDEMYGADRVVIELTKALGNYDLEVMLPDDVDYPQRLLSTTLDELQVPVRHVGLPVLRRAYLNPRGLLDLARRLVRWRRVLKESRPDVLYVNTSALLPAALMAPRSVRVLVHVHEHLDGLEGRILQLLMRRARKVVCVSEAVRSQLRGVVRERAVVVYNGFPDSPAAAVGTSWSESPSGEIRLLLASRWNSWKGHREFLDAWSRLSRDDLRLTILGGPPPVGESVDVRAIVAGLPNSSTVEILGETMDVEPYVIASHVVVVPSVRPDPLPTIAIEALAVGRPVLASDIGGLPEIIDDGATGALVTAGDPEAWAATLGRLSLSELARSAPVARSVFVERFSQAAFHDRIRQQIEKILA